MQFKAFDTVNTVTVYDGDRSVLSAVRERCMYFEGIFSRFIGTSDISRINGSSGSPVKVSSETADIVTRSIMYFERTDGRFDITVNGAVPGKCSEIYVSGQAVSVPEGVSLDLGGLAKGYIADDIKLLLQRSGVTCASIDLGGNVLVFGDRPDKDHWTIGIQRPFAPVGEYIAAVNITEGSCVTSGIYERFRTEDAASSHHIIDPFTGKSAATDIVSATVVAPSSTDADAFSTACLCAGSRIAPKLASRINAARLLLILSDGTLKWYGPEKELITG